MSVLMPGLSTLTLARGPSRLGQRPLWLSAAPGGTTSLTSAVGFSSLALADIPPVRVFGLFVAFGIVAAWLMALTVVPAVISLMDDDKLRRRLYQADDAPHSLLDRILRPIGALAFSRARLVLIFGALVLAFGAGGLV